MTNVYYLILDILVFALYAFLHSFLASLSVKNYLAQQLGNLMAFYRLFYNLLALWLLFYIYDSLPHPDIELLELKFPWDVIILVPQFLALAGIIWTLRYFSASEFLGFSQIKRYFNKSFVLDSANEPSENLTLVIKGPYKVVRHPLYLFTIIFFLLRPTMDLFYLVFLIFLIAYFYIGSFYEEKKLVSAFGDTYLNYQKSVPRLFPFLIS